MCGLTGFWLGSAIKDPRTVLRRMNDTLRHRGPDAGDIVFLDDVGLGGYENRIQDVKHLSKRLADFRRFRGAGLILSTP